jgi:hypothetical protein
LTHLTLYPLQVIRGSILCLLIVRLSSILVALHAPLLLVGSLSNSHAKSLATVAITDRVVLSTILFISALDIAGLYGKAEIPDILYWKRETIREINRRLNEHDHVATDGTIAAVACLSHLEVSFPKTFAVLEKVWADCYCKNLVGTAESAKIHARALDVMVSSRGGLQNLGANGMPRRIVSWSVSLGFER